MLGRAAYQRPRSSPRSMPACSAANRATSMRYVTHIATISSVKLAQGAPLNAMTKHMLGLFSGQPGARLFRRHLSENATRAGAGLPVLRDALAHLAQHSDRAAA